MCRILTNSIIAYWAVVGIILAGCGQLPAPGNANLEAGKPEREKEHSKAYLACRATFTTLEQDHPWSDESSLGHDDGKAPLALFVFVEPATHANRAIGILFKYAASVDAASPPVPADIGSQFTFQIPADFLSGNHKTIDNTNVRHFRKVEPQSDSQAVVRLLHCSGPVFRLKTAEMENSVARSQQRAKCCRGAKRAFV